MSKQIRLSKENSIIVGGRVFITLLKAIQIKSKVLKEKIDYSTSCSLAQLGKLVEYNGPYIEVGSIKRLG